MELANLGLVLKFAIIVIIYLIIFFALRIMYKDIRNIGKRINRTIGLEIIKKGDNSILRNGALIPVTNELTIGRNENNILVLNDRYVSAFHAKIYLKNADYIIEDNKSTNGTFVNDKRILKTILKNGDEIKIGTALFKVIG
ncbi:FHA domain-containing protein FhaB [Clostridium tepidiprofundi DSM 19306]|uniref:FHA domain-containing protein FhaB n=1 Tax=Clostridium tepidiprofundi DSM 19306 TaxID=1121338 RepID=A0A151B651_9CLOT|nr:FHA domain-containing protein [Clostridium tepidiprofundi]KYH35411.1 FHA domain-containing protein FhaB [Clostridium tepidiprofundi DSM 19306]